MNGSENDQAFGALLDDRASRQDLEYQCQKVYAKEYTKLGTSC